MTDSFTEIGYIMRPFRDQILLEAGRNITRNSKSTIQLKETFPLVFKHKTTKVSIKLQAVVSFSALVILKS
jgi:hypothetical protein